MCQSFGPGSSYDNPLASHYSKTMKDKSFYPINGPWQNHVLRRFAKLHRDGVRVVDIDDEVVDPDSLTRLVPLVALYATEGEEMMKKVEEHTLLMQSNDGVVAVTAVAARLLQLYILGHGHSDANMEKEEDEEEVVKTLIKQLKNNTELDYMEKSVGSLLQKVLTNKHLTTDQAIKVFGKD